MRSLSLSPASKRVVLVAIGAALVVLTATERQAAVLSIEAMPRRAFQEGYLIPQPAALKAIGLGHDEVMADLVWLSALSYFAVHMSLDRDYRWLDRYIETIIALDPSFRMIYHWAGVVTMYGGQHIDNRAVRTSNRFLEMGVERYPDDWFLNFMLGFNYRYELRAETEEAARLYRLLGATYLARAAEARDSPPWLSLTASGMLEEHGAQEEGIRLNIQSFLNLRAATSATLAATQSARHHYPDIDRDNVDLSALVSIGAHLRRMLPDVEFASLLLHRRALEEDLDTEVGYLRWSLRTLIAGEPPLRVDPSAPTPLDEVYAPSPRPAVTGNR